MMGMQSNRYLCQTISTLPAFIGGTLRLNKKYSGPILQVYNGTTTKDVGSVNEIAAFCSSSDGTVATIYDQSGNGRNFTQSTAANRPKIYDGASTSLLRSNTKGPACMRFNGTTHVLSRSDACGISSTSDITVYQLGLQNGTANSAYTSWGSSSGSATNLELEYIPNIASTGKNVPRSILNGVADDYYDDSSFAGTLSKSFHYDVVELTHGVNAGSGGVVWRLNGSALSQTINGIDGASNLNNLGAWIGSNSGGTRFLLGDFSVIGMWNPKLGSTDRAALEKWSSVHIAL